MAIVTFHAGRCDRLPPAQAIRHRQPFGHNILDQGFDYQDDSYREFQDAASIGLVLSERLISATLNW